RSALRRETQQYQGRATAVGLPEDFLPETQQPSCEPLRLRERDQMSARNHLHLSVEPFPSDTLLKLEREEAIVRRRDHEHRNWRPPLKLAGLAEYLIGLLPLLRRPAAKYCLRDIVQKVRRKVELRGVPSGPGRGDSRVHGARIAPPGP